MRKDTPDGLGAPRAAGGCYFSFRLMPMKSTWSSDRIAIKVTGPVPYTSDFRPLSFWGLSTSGLPNAARTVASLLPGPNVIDTVAKDPFGSLTADYHHVRIGFVPVDIVEVIIGRLAAPIAP